MHNEPKYHDFVFILGWIDLSGELMKIRRVLIKKNSFYFKLSDILTLTGERLTILLKKYFKIL
jgi:hypothetical protein